jgi:hypothetical protein
VEFRSVPWRLAYLFAKITSHAKRLTHRCSQPLAVVVPHLIL